MSLVLVVVVIGGTSRPLDVRGGNGGGWAGGSLCTVESKKMTKKRNTEKNKNIPRAQTTV
jgi:hypothetical protein